jgi:hypothetical protein
MFWPVWLLVAGGCASMELAALVATDFRVSSWGDVAFVVIFTCVSAVAFVNATSLLWRSAGNPY